MTCKEYFEVVSRNAACARVCLSLEEARAHAGEEDSPRGHEGNIFAKPPDDELIPWVAYDAPPIPNFFPGVRPGVEFEWQSRHSMTRPIVCPSSGNGPQGRQNNSR